LAGFLLLAALGLADLAPQARAADCAPPGWFNTIRLKQRPDEFIATGKGEDVLTALREARRQLGAVVAKKLGKEILELPNVKPSLNLKVYRQEEYLKGLPAAVAVDLYSFRLLKGETVCGEQFVAVGMSKSEAVDDLTRQSRLIDHMYAAITGAIEKYETERVREERPIAKTPSFAPQEAAVQRLRAFAKGLKTSDVYESQWLDPLQKRIDRITPLIAAADKLTWTQARAKAVEPITTAIVAAEKYAAAVRDWRSKEYIAAFNIFSDLAAGGDAAAQFTVAMMYYEAQGVKRDYREAMTWLRRSADQGNALAKPIIGFMYLTGRGVEADMQQGLDWIKAGQDDGASCRLEMDVQSCRAAGAAGPE
jgi:hypothetical protein